MTINKTILGAVAFSLPLLAGSFFAWAAQAPGGAPALRPPTPPAAPMTFFVTSVGLGKGGDLGGLAGADAHCQALAQAVGSTKTWHAFLSTQARPGQPAVNARDRIGKGPWHNSKNGIIAADLNELLGDTLESAQQGNGMWKLSIITEKGQMIAGEADNRNIHNILTGSTTDGRAYTDNADRTCNNWTSSSSGGVRVGHSDRTGAGNISWSSSEDIASCDQREFQLSHGAGLFYCFAID